MSDAAADAALFEKIGIPANKAKEYAGNAKLGKKLRAMIALAGIGNGCDKSVGNILATVATKIKRMEQSKHLDKALPYVADGKVSSSPQVTELVKFCLKGPAEWDAKVFSTACGVGVNVTTEDICSAIANIFKTNEAKLKEQRYRCMGMLLGQIRGNPKLKWADGKTVKTEFDKMLLAALGPKTAEDMKKNKGPKPAKAKGKAKTAENDEKEDDSTDITKMTTEELTQMLMGREIPWMHNTKEQKETHLKTTEGLQRFRFPPEPNGYLHIGHAKAMNFNFGVAKKMGGVCYLRFDDTNPEAEKKEYIDSIAENVKFLGHEPWKITYSSDSFEQLYAFAVKLIKKNKAFVCHMKGDEVKEAKKLKQKQPPSPWRDRPISESLMEFEKMRKGYYAEGEATLRLKMDITHDNPNLWDIIAYRIRFTEHPHAGKKWCIYPSYDFTHCIIDSLEDITHSCCTLEFENRRESYYWLLDELEIFKPNVWEYGRLNIKSNVLSKRKLRQLVVEQHVKGWDDPRLLTINGLRRRGYTHEGINTFCDVMGVSRSTTVWADYERLERCGRAALNVVAPRRMVVIDPLKVVLTNYDGKKERQVTCHDFPENMADMGCDTKTTYTTVLGHVCYIERKDFRPSANKNYFGMVPGKTCRLLHAYNVKCERFDVDKDGEPSVVYCTIDFDNKEKVKKGFLHWVSAPAGAKEPLRVTVNLYEKLFLADRPGETEHGDKVDYLTQLNPNSLKVARGFANAEMADAKVGDKFQFERLGFFVVDKASTKKNLVFNRTMGLSESRELKKQKGGNKDRRGKGKGKKAKK